MTISILGNQLEIADLRVTTMQTDMIVNKQLPTDRPDVKIRATVTIAPVMQTL
jgi:hypothetical protein